MIRGKACHDGDDNDYDDDGDHDDYFGLKHVANNCAPNNDNHPQ